MGVRLSPFRMDNIRREDWKFVKPDPDPGFSEEHNRKVIERTIRKNDALRIKKLNDFKEGVRERSDSLATYIKSLDQGGRETNIEKYFGRKYLAYLRGKEIVERIKDKLREGEIIRRV